MKIIVENNRIYKIPTDEDAKERPEVEVRDHEESRWIPATLIGVRNPNHIGSDHPAARVDLISRNGPIAAGVHRIVRRPLLVRRDFAGKESAMGWIGHVSDVDRKPNKGRRMNAREIAQRTVDQWDKYDQFHAVRVAGDDQEPSGVKVARAYVAMCQTVEEVERWLAASVKDGTFKTAWEQGIAIDVGCKLIEATRQ